MPDDPQLNFLRRELARLKSRLAEEEAALRKGSPEKKVEAAGAIAELTQRASALEARLDRAVEGESSQLSDELALELRDLAYAFERWLEGRPHRHHSQR